MSDKAEPMKKTLDRAEASRLLRELADKIENGTLAVGKAGAVPLGLLRVKVSGKSKEGSASLSVKLQWECSPSEDAAAPLSKKTAKPRNTKTIPSYKSIKKRMGSTFKEIRVQLGAGALPDAELADLFDRDAGLMLNYPKKGEVADINAFRKISAAFAAAVKAGDLEAAGHEAAALAAAEKSCHRRYK